jgi:hypothetical protein
VQPHHRPPVLLAVEALVDAVEVEPAQLGQVGGGPQVEARLGRSVADRPVDLLEVADLEVRGELQVDDLARRGQPTSSPTLRTAAWKIDSCGWSTPQTGDQNESCTGCRRTTR